MKSVCALVKVKRLQRNETQAPQKLPLFVSETFPLAVKHALLFLSALFARREGFERIND